MALRVRSQCVAGRFRPYTGDLPVTDCDDVNPAMGPDMEDIPDDGIDQDSSGSDARSPVIGGGLSCSSAPPPYSLLFLVGLTGLLVRRRTV